MAEMYDTYVEKYGKDTPTTDGVWAWSRTYPGLTSVWGRRQPCIEAETRDEELAAGGLSQVRAIWFWCGGCWRETGTRISSLCSLVGRSAWPTKNGW